MQMMCSIKNSVYIFVLYGYQGTIRGRGGMSRKIKKKIFFWIFYMFKEYNLRFIIISILLSSLLNSVIGIKFISSIGMDVEKFHLHLMTCIYMLLFFCSFGSSYQSCLFFFISCGVKILKCPLFFLDFCFFDLL